MTQPEWIFPVAAIEAVDMACKLGIRQLVLEDAKVAIRGTDSHDFLDPTFTKWEVLAARARAQCPDIQLSVTMDLMVHHGHSAMIELALETARCLGISRFRVQDLGLVDWIRSTVGDAHVTVACENGFANRDAIMALGDAVNRIYVPCEVPAPDIAELKSTGKELEILVLGPIVIQYSQRRFQEVRYGGDRLPSGVILTQAQDVEFPGRVFRMMDTPNGHLMYAPFDRCLLNAIDPLVGTGIKNWLIDSRFGGLDYLSAGIAAFQVGLQNLAEGKSTDFVDALAGLDKMVGVPHKVGFFYRNNTDAWWKSTGVGDSRRIIGSVIAVTTTGSHVIEVEAPFELPLTVTATPPDGCFRSIDILEMTDLDGNPQMKAVEGALMVVPKIRGITPKTRLTID